MPASAFRGEGSSPRHPGSLLLGGQEMPSSDPRPSAASRSGAAAAAVRGGLLSCLPTAHTVSQYHSGSPVLALAMSPLLRGGSCDRRDGRDCVRSGGWRPPGLPLVPGLLRLGARSSGGG